MKFLIEDGHFRWCPHLSNINSQIDCWCKLAAYGIAVTIGFSVAFFQAWGSSVSHSLANLGDAIHTFTDAAFVYIISAWATWLKMKSKSHVESLDNRWANRNAWILTAIAYILFALAIVRFINPDTAVGSMMLFVAVVGLCMNIVVWRMLALLRIEHSHVGCSDSTHDHEDKVHSTAKLHALFDAMVSLVVIIAALGIMYFPVWPALVLRFDPIATIIIGVWLIILARKIRQEIRARKNQHIHKKFI